MADAIPSVSLNWHGRSGILTFERGGRRLLVECEQSGSSEYDLLIAPIDLRHWQSPEGTALSLEEQLVVLSEIRTWLESAGLYSDIAIVDASQDSAQRCQWAGCEVVALESSAFCRMHRDFQLLVL